jgi:hypothetical protein
MKPRECGKARRAPRSTGSVVLLTARGETDWCKSQRASGPELGLTLALLPFKDPSVVQVNVTGDVMVGRKDLWHLRDPQPGHINEAVREILTGGRTGQFRAA